MNYETRQSCMRYAMSHRCIFLMSRKQQKLTKSNDYGGLSINIYACLRYNRYNSLNCIGRDVQSQNKYLIHYYIIVLVHKINYTLVTQTSSILKHVQ